MTGGTGGVLLAPVIGVAGEVVKLSPYTRAGLIGWAAVVALESAISGISYKCVPN